MIERIRNKIKMHSKLTLPFQSTFALTLEKGNVNIMGKSLQLAVLLTFLYANLFGQSINSVTVSPQDPTSADEVSLVVNGDRWSSDMYISSIAVQQNLNTWHVDIEFMSEGIGLPVVIPFDTVVSLGTMTIGYYDCQVNGVFNGNVEDFDGTSWAVLEPVGVADNRSEELKLMCTPNPIGAESKLHLFLPKAGKASLKLYDILGQERDQLFNEHFNAGVHQIKFFGAQLPEGRYYFHLNSGGETLVYSVLKK